MKEHDRLVLAWEQMAGACAAGGDIPSCRNSSTSFSRGR
jgi:hypothetical protein